MEKVMEKVLRKGGRSASRVASLPVALSLNTNTTVANDTSSRPKPFVKWVGGKRQLVPELFRAMSDAGTKGHYYEPFVGGGAFFFAQRAEGWCGSATLGDSNDLLIRAYRGVRDNVYHVMRGLTGAIYDKTAFLYERSNQPKADWIDTDVAVWLIYMNKSCFNGLWRVNSKGEFNVPFGRYVNPVLCDASTLLAASVALSKIGRTEKTELLSADFEDVVRNAKRGDRVYFDPPYVPVSTTAHFTGYTTGSFSIADQTRLRNCAWRLRERGVHVVLSNADVPLVRELYKRFDLRAVQARRAVNSDASKRGSVGEVIIT
jgi:DNA adenine methylase